MKEESQEYKYWAFISYSHSDEKWARWLHKSLERFRIPRDLARKKARHPRVNKRLYPVFRDREELPSSSNLTEKLTTALELSRYLIVICSPKASVSKWVNEEIKTFQRLGRHDRVLCLVVDGEPNAAPESGQLEAFPPAVRFRYDQNGEPTNILADPIAADVRDGKDGKSDAKLKLIAGILGVGFDELKRRDRRRRFVIRAQALAAGVLVLGVIFWIWWQGQLTADRHRRVAFAGELATAARQTLETHPQRSLLLALEAVRASPDSLRRPIADAEQALRNALAGTGGLLLNVGDLYVRALAYSNDGRWLAAASGAQVRLWHLLDGRPVGQPVILKSPGKFTRMLEFSPDHRWLAAAGDNGVNLWPLSSPDREAPSEIFLPHKNTYQDTVEALAFSADGKWLATGDREANARIWNLGDIDSSATPITLGGHRGGVMALAFSNDGRWLAIGSGNDKAELWDRRDLKSGPAYRLKNQLVATLAFSPDSKWLSIGEKNGVATLWSMDFLKEPKAAWDHSGMLDIVRFSADGRWLGTGSAGGTVRLWDMNELETEPVILPDKGGSGKLVFSEDSEIIAAPAGHGQVRVWKTATPHSAPRRLLGHETIIESVAMNPDGDWIAAGGKDGTVRLWNIAAPSNEPLDFLDHGDLAISPDARFAAIGDVNGAIHMIDLLNPIPARMFSTGKEHAAPIKKVIMSPNGKWLVSADRAGSVKRWEVSPEGSLSTPIDIWKDERSVTEIKFSPDSQWLTVSRQGGSVFRDGWTQLWRMAETIADPIALRDGGGHEGSIDAVEFSPDSRWLATGGADGSALLWKLFGSEQEPQNVRLTVHHEKKVLRGGVLTSVHNVAFSPDGSYFAAGSGVGKLLVWDMDASGPAKDPKNLEVLVQYVSTLSFSPDGRWLTAGGSSDVQLWDLSTEDRAPRTIKGHAGRVGATMFSPDGRYLATGSQDGTARVWDLSHSDPATSVMTLPGDPASTKYTTLVRFAADGQWLITSGNGATRLWDLSTPAPKAIVLGEKASFIDIGSDGRWLAMKTPRGVRLSRLNVNEILEIACVAVGRDLTKREWAEYFGERPYRKTCM